MSFCHFTSHYWAAERERQRQRETRHLSCMSACLLDLPQLRSSCVLAFLSLARLCWFSILSPKLFFPLSCSRVRTWGYSSIRLEYQVYWPSSPCVWSHNKPSSWLMDKVSQYVFWLDACSYIIRQVDFSFRRPKNFFSAKSATFSGSVVFILCWLL